MSPSRRLAQRLLNARPVSQYLSHIPKTTISPLLTRSAIRPSRNPPTKPFQPLLTLRYNSSLSVPGQEPNQTPSESTQPAYSLTFTCKPCGHRSSHRVSKQGYHHGTVLIQCPSCKNRHVISDHLKIFIDTKSTLEDILRAKLELGEKGDLSAVFKKGQLGIRQGAMVGNEGEEDIEFWDDGTVSVHKAGT